MSGGIIKMRSGQRRLFELVELYRTLAFVARRQYGKTTSFANIALYKMMKTIAHTVIFGSAKLNLSREIVRKEAGVMSDALAAIRRDGIAVSIADQKTGEPVAKGIDADGFAELFEAQRLEFRYHHDRGVYSRTKVVALRADAVGETGDLMLDEVGRINNWQEVWEAVEPIIASNPDFRLLISTTPPPDSAHYSFEQLAPAPGSAFEPSKIGNVYESIGGITVLRLDAYDAMLDNVPLYNAKTGKAMSPEEARKQARDKDAWDRNYGCAFVESGSSAMTYAALADAMAKGEAAGCVFCEDAPPPNFARLFKPGEPVAIGLDIATTDGEASNPSGLCAMQRDGERYAARLMMKFKSSDPATPRSILRELCDALKPVSVALDATSERYWCRDTKTLLEPATPVLLVVASERCPEAGDNPPENYKNYLGHLAAGIVEDRQALLPAAQYIKDDFRLPRKHKGGINNALDSETGAHGDMFDGFKLAIHALNNGEIKTEIEAADTRDRPQAQPRRWDRPPREYEDTLNAANAGRYLP